LKLCTTRWVKRHEAFIRFDQILPAVILFLEYTIECLDGQILTKVNGLYSSILTFNFFNNITSHFKYHELYIAFINRTSMSNFWFIWSSNFNGICSYCLKNQRNENDFIDIFKKAQDLANQFNIEIWVPITYLVYFCSPHY